MEDKEGYCEESKTAMQKDHSGNGNYEKEEQENKQVTADGILYLTQGIYPCNNTTFDLCLMIRSMGI